MTFFSKCFPIVTTKTIIDEDVKALLIFVTASLVSSSLSLMKSRVYLAEKKAKSPNALKQPNETKVYIFISLSLAYIR